jgi:signal peptidase II
MPTLDRAPRRSPLLPVLILAVSIALDQLTKAAARAWLTPGVRHSYLGDLFRLELIWNPGAFLSLGAELPPAVRSAVFTWGVAALVAGAAFVALRAHARVVAVGAALVAGGGLGNLWDRVTAGGLVVDFMNLGLGRLRTGIFNVADLAIVAGAVVLIFAPGKPEAPAAPGDRDRPDPADQGRPT